MMSEIIRPAAKAIITFLETFGDVGAFGVVALSTILSFALSFTLAIVFGAIFAIALPMFFDSDGLPEFTSALKTSVSSMLSNLIIDLSCDTVYFSLSSFETEL